MWFVIAELLLRDEDIGAIVSRVHAALIAWRSPRLTDAEVAQLDARLASAHRKRVNVLRLKSGYITG
ncbi:MAG: hypothetical protein ACKV2T_32845 [Kofleriaceae bacterium]